MKRKELKKNLEGEVAVLKKLRENHNIEALIGVALVMVIIWLFTQISGTVWPVLATFIGSIAPLVLGLIFAFMLNPFVEDITKRFFHGYKFFGVAITFTIIITSLVFVIYPIAHDLIVQAPELIKYLSTETESLLNSMTLINPDVKKQILDYLSSYGANFTQTILNSVNNIVTVTVQTFLTFIVMAFALLEYDSIVSKVTLLFKKAQRPKVFAYIEGLEKQLYFYLRSLVLGLILLTLVFGVVLHFLSINNAWSFAIIMSLLIVLIPVVGPLIATGILAVITIPIGTTATTVGFIGLAIFTQLFINIISPKIFARMLDLSNLLIIASFMIGFALLGITGALFAVPTVIVILYTYNFFDKEYHWSDR